MYKVLWQQKKGGMGFNLPVMQEMKEMHIQSLGWEDLPEESNILAWRIPWTEEPGRLQSIGLQKVRHK